MSRSASRRLFSLALCLGLAACAATAPREEAAAVFVVVRHAEKVADGSKDPPLTDAGRQRAASLAAALREVPLVAAYATPFRRTRETAQPAADAHGLQLLDYDAGTSAPELAATLRRAHPSGTVLVVGHSNTVPEIVSALCGCAVAPIDESRYGDLFEIRSGRDGRPQLRHARF